MTEINIKTQKTILEIVQDDKIITIESKTELPAGYKSIISKFVETFEIVSIKDIPELLPNKFGPPMNVQL